MAKKTKETQEKISRKMNSLYGQFYEQQKRNFYYALSDKCYKSAVRILNEFPEPPRKLARVYANHVINSGNYLFLEVAEKLLGRKFNKSELNRFKKVAAIADEIHA